MTLDELEYQRRLILKDYRLIKYGLAIPITLIFYYFIFFNNPSGLEVKDFDFMHYLILPVIPIIGLMIGIGTAEKIMRKKTKSFTNSFAQDYAQDIYKEHFSNVAFKQEGLMPHEVFETRLIKPGPNFESYDNVTGEYNNIKFKRTNLHVETAKSGDNNTSSTIFSGQWIQLYNVSSLINDVYVVSPHFTTDALADGLFKQSDYTVFKTDINQFNEHFKIYAKSEQSVQPLLIQTFIDKLYPFKDIRHFGIAFYNEHVTIAVGGKKKSLSPTLFESIHTSAVANVDYDIHLIKQCVSIFKSL